jgi:hypothetical protein
VQVNGAVLNVGVLVVFKVLVVRARDGPNRLSNSPRRIFSSKRAPTDESGIQEEDLRCDDNEAFLVASMAEQCFPPMGAVSVFLPRENGSSAPLPYVFSPGLSPTAEGAGSEV